LEVSPVESGQWYQLAGTVVAVLALLVTAYKALNRKSAAYDQAANSLSLVKALDELKLGEGEARELRTMQTLRRQLIERVFLSTQVYVNATRPTLTSQWQAVYFYAVGLILFIWFQIYPVTGSMADPVSVALPFVIIGATIAVAQFVTHAVERYKADSGALRKSGGRAAERKKAVKRQSQLRRVEARIPAVIGDRSEPDNEEGR
jgi:hypothetical protein